MHGAPLAEEELAGTGKYALHSQDQSCVWAGSWEVIERFLIQFA